MPKEIYKLDAEYVYHDIREEAERILGSEHPNTLRIMHNSASELNELQKHKESEDLFLDTLEKQNRVFCPDHPLTNKKFLSLWKDADPGIAEVEDARKRPAGSMEAPSDGNQRGQRLQN